MKQHKILQLIYKDLGELQELTNELIQTEDRSQIEIEIALSKAKLISQEFELLKETSHNSKISADFVQPLQTREVVQEKPHKQTINTDSITKVVIPKEEEHIVNTEEISDTTTKTNEFVTPELKDIEEKIEETPVPESIIESPESSEEVQIKEEENKLDENPDIEEEEEEEEEEPSVILGETFSKGKSLNDSINDNQTLDQKIANSPIKKLTPAIGLNDRFLFIRELFEGDSDHFLKTISDIDKMNNLKEAVNYLSTNHKWKKNEASLKFVELVKRRFQ